MVTCAARRVDCQTVGVCHWRLVRGVGKGIDVVAQVVVITIGVDGWCPRPAPSRSVVVAVIVAGIGAPRPFLPIGQPSLSKSLSVSHERIHSAIRFEPVQPTIAVVICVAWSQVENRVGKNKSAGRSVARQVTRACVASAGSARSACVCVVPALTATVVPNADKVRGARPSS
jgi:hypothetical protein